MVDNQGFKNTIDAYYRVIKTNKDGEQVFDSGKILSKSYVLQFMMFVYCGMCNCNVTINQTSGSGTTVYSPYETYGGVWMNCQAPANTGAYGIVVGSGTDPVLLSNASLKTIIGHGLSNGLLVYGTNDFYSYTSTSSWSSFLMTRNFYNNNAVGTPDITINEIGVYVAAQTNNGAGNRYFMIVRDVLGTPISVGPEEGATIHYYLETEVQT